MKDWTPATYENPSAEKFEPPPDAADVARRRRWRFIGMALSVGYLAAHWLLSLPAPRWLRSIIALAFFVFVVAEFVLHRKELEDNEPYTPPTTITR